jgi:hypothetical protein
MGRRDRQHLRARAKGDQSPAAVTTGLSLIAGGLEVLVIGHVEQLTPH